MIAINGLENLTVNFTLDVYAKRVAKIKHRIDKAQRLIYEGASIATLEAYLETTYNEAYEYAIEIMNFHNHSNNPILVVAVQEAFMQEAFGLNDRAYHMYSQFVSMS